MKITLSCIVLFLFALAIIVSCKKNDNPATPLTEANLAGTYALKALTWTYAGVTINVYDSLDACDKDNLLKLNTDKTLNFIDAGIVCNPSESANGVWALHGDSLVLGGTGPIESSKIKSFDGTTLVVTGTPSGQPGVTGVTTLKKQ